MKQKNVNNKRNESIAIMILIIKKVSGRAENTSGSQNKFPEE